MKKVYYGDKCRIRTVYLALFMFCFDGCVENSIHFKVVSLLFVVSVGNIYSAFSLWQFILYSDLAVETLTPEHINISVSIKTSKCER